MAPRYLSKGVCKGRSWECGPPELLTCPEAQQPLTAEPCSPLALQVTPHHAQGAPMGLPQPHLRPSTPLTPPQTSDSLFMALPSPSRILGVTGLPPTAKGRRGRRGEPTHVKQPLPGAPRRAHPKQAAGTHLTNAKQVGHDGLAGTGQRSEDRAGLGQGHFLLLPSPQRTHQGPWEQNGENITHSTSKGQEMESQIPTKWWEWQGLGPLPPHHCFLQGPSFPWASKEVAPWPAG